MIVRSAHIVYIPFTDVGLRGFRPAWEQEWWFAERIEIFKKYTLQSLVQQTNKKFVLWISLRNEDKKSHSLKRLIEYLKQSKIPCFISFNGLMYYDDKFERGFIPWCMNAARVLRWCYRERSIKNLWPRIKELQVHKNETLIMRLREPLRVLKENLGDPTWVYLSRIDSDDMFHKDFIQEIQNIPAFSGAIVCRNGYIYNAKTGEVAEWNPKTNPPFHTIVFPASVFFDPFKYHHYYKGFKSHEDIPKLFNHVVLGDGKYCVLVHDSRNQISTIFNHPFKGRTIEENKKEILSNFGIKYEQTTNDI